MLIITIIKSQLQGNLALFIFLQLNLNSKYNLYNISRFFNKIDMVTLFTERNIFPFFIILTLCKCFLLLPLTCFNLFLHIHLPVFENLLYSANKTFFLFGFCRNVFSFDEISLNLKSNHGSIPWFEKTTQTHYVWTCLICFHSK